MPRYEYSEVWPSNAVLEGKTAIVTGGNNGIGKEVVKDFYKRGARIIIVCRNVKQAEVTIKEIKSIPRDNEFNNDIIVKYLDLGDFATVRSCARDILNTEKAIHYLVNNAGVIAPPVRKNTDGFDMTLAVNYLGHFLFTLLLLPKIVKSDSARIINVSSMAHSWPIVGNKINLDDLNFERRTYSNWKAYAQSKLALTMFSKELTWKLRDDGVYNVTTYTVDPGPVRTDIVYNYFDGEMHAPWLYTKFLKIFFSTPEKGAQTIIYCTLNEKLASESGLYYYNMKTKSPSPRVIDEKLRRRLWNDSLKYVGITDRNELR